MRILKEPGQFCPGPLVSLLVSFRWGHAVESANTIIWIPLTIRLWLDHFTLGLVYETVNICVSVKTTFVICVVEERECSLRNKVVDDMNFVYMVFSGLQAVLSIGKAVPQCFLSGLIYWCILSFQVTFLPWGFLRRALLYLSTLTLLLHLIS